MQNNKTFKILKKYRTLVLVFFILIIVFLLSIKGIYRCPLNYIFGIPCPFCGMTRAIVSALSLDIKKAFYYHALWPIVIFGTPIYFILKDKLKKYINIILIIIGIIFLIYYIYRHIIGSPIVEIDFKNSLIYKLIK